MQRFPRFVSRYGRSLSTASSTPIFNPLDSLAPEQQKPADAPSSMPVPAGVSPLFFAEYNRLNDQEFQSILDSQSIRSLSYQIKSPQDSQLFESILTRYQKTKPLPLPDRALILGLLLESKSFSTLLNLLCNQPLHQLRPSKDQLESLFNGFLESLSRAPSDESKLEILDNLYKTFAVFLYYNVSPSAQIYHGLVKAGVESGLEEGKRRSTMTIKEMKTLGVEVDAEFETLLE